jgi:hypothetical protein
VLDPLVSDINDFLRRAAVFLHSLERGYFAQSWCSPQMKTVTGRQCSFKQQTQFTMLNKVLDPFASNINDSLTLATLHLPFTRTGWVWTKAMFVIHENTEWKEVFPCISNSIPFRKHVLDLLLLTSIFVLQEMQSVLVPFIERGGFVQIDVPLIWQHWEVCSIPLNIKLNSLC